MLIDGRKIAQELLATLRALSAPERSIRAVLVGNDASSRSFLRQKGIVADFLGIDFSVRELPPESSIGEVLALLNEFGADQGVGGVIVQLPLPQHVSRSKVLEAIPPELDIDCLSPRNFARFESGGVHGGGYDGLMPPAAGAIAAIVQALDLHLGSMRAAVVGSGLLVGKPAMIYLGRHAKSVEVLGRADDLGKRLSRADLIVSGTGVGDLIKADYVKRGAVVLDFGYPHDAEFEAIDAKGGIVTPTPGGTGPIVVAKLFENFYRLHGSFPGGKK